MSSRDYPAMTDSVGKVEPVAKRIRGFLGDAQVFDTTAAIYVWEWPNYPVYLIPYADFAAGALVGEGRAAESILGPAASMSLATRPGAAHLLGEGSVAPGMVKVLWGSLDHWWEEDEEVFVHARNPYTRVDALRSSRRIRVERKGVVLADALGCVMVFETGLPTRYYLDRSALKLEHLEPSDTVTECPYKGRTTGYWSVRAGGKVIPDIAWVYDFPTRELLAIAGLVAFYNERTDIFIDDVLQGRPVTHF